MESAGDALHQSLMPFTLSSRQRSRCAYLVRAGPMNHRLTGHRLQGLHYFQLLLVEGLHFVLLEEFFDFLTQQQCEAIKIQSVFIAAGDKVLKCPTEKKITLLLSVCINRKQARRSHFMPVLVCCCFEDFFGFGLFVCFFKKG